MQLTLLFVAALYGADAAEDLTSLRPAPGETPASALFYSDLQRQAYAALDRRQAAYEELKTPEQIAAYQKRLREFIHRATRRISRAHAAQCRKSSGSIDADGYRSKRSSSRASRGIT